MAAPNNTACHASREGAASGDAERAVPNPEDIAAVDFEAWNPAPDMASPPTNDEWCDLTRSHLPYTRIAYALMFKTKAELVEAARALGADQHFDLIDEITAARKFFSAHAELCDGAASRLIVAAAVVGAEQEASA